MSKVIGVLCLVERDDGTKVVMGSRAAWLVALQPIDRKSYANVESVLSGRIRFEAVVEGWKPIEVHHAPRLTEETP